MSLTAEQAVSSGGGRPKAYLNAAGNKVPGVTTILGKFKDAGGLIHWAWQLGRDGEDYREARDAAGGIGHVVHHWIDDSIHGRPLRAVDQPKAAQDLSERGFEAFERWRLGVNLQILDTERPLVSELHQFGGTYDAIAMVNGAVTLLDWKTGNRVYSEHIAQCAAYRQLLREVGKQQIQGGARLLRVGKIEGDFHDHSYPSNVLDIGWDRFLASKWLFETDKLLQKVLG